MSQQGQKLFDLLPALYKLRDARLVPPLSATQAEQLAALQVMPTPLSPANQALLNQLLAQTRGPLQCLLMLIGEQLGAVATDLDQLYDNQFIETCAPWIIPYIGDLIGYKPVNGVAPSVASPRAEVANTISFRRRKGTVLVLEQLARDVSGWGAHAVEFFTLLQCSQYMNHIRPNCLCTADLRNWQLTEYIATAFDGSAYTVDVRNIAAERGRYNIPNIGIFLWSLNPYSLTSSQAVAASTNVAASAQCFRFSPLGADVPLFNNPVSQGTDITLAAQPINVPNRLSRRVLCQDLQDPKGPSYYGEGKSLALYNYDPATKDYIYVEPSQIQVCDLSGEDGLWVNVPTSSSIYAATIDPELGRIALPPLVGPAPPAELVASFYYGFNADMGGGEYSRVDTFAASPEQPVVRVPGDQPTVSLAVAALSGDGVVEITDSGRYEEPGGFNVSVNAGGQIELRGADGCHPTLALGGAISVTGGANSHFYINGLLIAFAPVTDPASKAPLYVSDTGNQLSYLGVTHCTLVPGWSLTSQGSPQFPGEPALVVESSYSELQVVVQKSIVGPLYIAELVTATVSDSFVDATSSTSVAYSGVDGLSGGGALTLQGCTVIGKIHATLLTLVSDSILLAQLATNDSWTAPLWADRKQKGCVRFSYLPAGAVIPRQFQCAVEGEGLPQPIFYSLRYGSPGYGKLVTSTDDAIRRGADDGGEMGGFHFVLSPQRETDLLTRIEEYLPVGQSFGIFYET
jgi:hypothetical protein